MRTVLTPGSKVSYGAFCTWALWSPVTLTVNPLTKIDVIDKVAHLSHGNCVPSMTFLLLSIFDLVAGSRRLQPYEGAE